MYAWSRGEWRRNNSPNASGASRETATIPGSSSWSLAWLTIAMGVRPWDASSVTRGVLTPTSIPKPVPRLHLFSINGGRNVRRPQYGALVDLLPLVNEGDSNPWPQERGTG
ncbi:hypothetical protein GCM10010191_52010 [Actinomadura vinacea]|uniref:Uncharacterized protein n=1 Tax=Actinomadura vinacea TaxID=115336 RepID=A0ABN3JJ04_9ACTN